MLQISSTGSSRLPHLPHLFFLPQCICACHPTTTRCLQSIFAGCLCAFIHSFILRLSLRGSLGGRLDLIPAVTGLEAAYTLDRLPVNRKAYTLTSAPAAYLRPSINPAGMSLDCGRKEAGEPGVDVCFLYLEYIDFWLFAKCRRLLVLCLFACT